MNRHNYKEIAFRRGTPKYRVKEFEEDEREYFRQMEKYCDYLEQQVKNCSIPDVSVSFADYLISDFEMVSEGVEEELLWQLCGTKQRYTSEEIYNVFINER